MTHAELAVLRERLEHAASLIETLQKQPLPMSASEITAMIQV
jgi:hypothetical protein